MIGSLSVFSGVKVAAIEKELMTYENPFTKQSFLYNKEDGYEVHDFSEAPQLFPFAFEVESERIYEKHNLFIKSEGKLFMAEVMKP